MGLPTFEASDLEQGGKSARIVNCVLALKLYYEWKQGGGIGSWKYGGALKAPACGKYFLRKNSEPFSRTLSWGEKSHESLSCEDLYEASSSNSLHALVCEVLSDKRQEDIPIIVENLLSKVMEEFEHRLAKQGELMKTTSKDMTLSGPDRPLSDCASECASGDMKTEEKAASETKEEEIYNHEEGSESQSLKQITLVDRQQKDIQELKHTLYDTKAGMKLLQMRYRQEFNNLERVSTVELGAARVNKDSADAKELKEQIATLKAALARKESEGAQAQLKYSQSMSPERSRIKSAGSSPLHSNWKSTGDLSGASMQAADDFGNIELPEMFGPSSLPDPPKLYMEPHFGKSMIPSLIPSPSRKPPNAVSQPLHRTASGRIGEGKRRPGSAK
ncbi:hypothetical protein C1H46_044074 [Malus baccata]|uniref:Kinesin motor domain-containing protein n=1 Tax=Malus baccata TaxID=106549 RepID=A0A540K851_MALBA|nr:hypothetical protein C1H46_044074 [Malus baccata]